MVFHSKVILSGLLPCPLHESLPIRLPAEAVRCSNLCEEPFDCAAQGFCTFDCTLHKAFAHLIRSPLVQEQVHHCNLFQVVTPFGISRVPQSDRKVVKVRLYKYEVRSIFTRAAVIHIHPSPPPVAPRSDHVLEPGHFALDSVARAAIAKMRSACFRLTRDAHFFTSFESFGFFASSTSRHCLVHLEHHTVLVCVLLLWHKILQVCSNFVFLGSLLLLALAIFPRQKHPSLSESRLAVP